MKQFAHIKEIISDMKEQLKMDQNLERDVQRILMAAVSQLYHSSLNNTEGYCIKFQLPLSPVNSLYKKFKLTPAAVEVAFRNDWGYPMNTKMYSDAYYQALLLMITLGLQINNKAFVNNSLLLMLIKLWNGRRQEFIPYCNPSIMRYVTTTMLSGKFHAAKYDTPLALLANYFVPQLLTKYSDIIKTDHIKLKYFFSQSYSRIFQLFYQQPKINPISGKKESTSGLSALYYKASNEGASSRNSAMMADKESGEISYDQYGSSSEIDEIVNNVTDFIVLNKQTSYPEGFIKQINRLTHVSAKVINNLAIDLHNPKYHDYLVDLLTLILGRLKIRTKSEICSAQFILDIKKKIISSKNNQDSKRIVSIIDIMLDKLFKDAGLAYSRYSTVQRIQIRAVLIHIIVFNLKKVVCHHQATQQINFLSNLKPNDII